jgi:hypothetical protein
MPISLESIVSRLCEVNDQSIMLCLSGMVIESQEILLCAKVGHLLIKVITYYLPITIPEDDKD